MKAILTLALPIVMHAQLVERETEKDRESRQRADAKAIAALGED